MLKRAGPGTMAMAVLAKFVFGLGLGMLITTYWPTTGWNPWGWALIVASILISLPAMRVFLGKK